MRNERTLVIRDILAMSVLIFGINDVVMAQVIDTGLFTQNRLRDCGSPTDCFGRDPTREVQSDFDLSVTGSVATLVGDVALGAQAATSAGYDGVALTPALSAYAYTAGPQRYTLVSFGFQQYEFVAAGQVTIDGTLTFSQTGEISPEGENARGIVIAGLSSFQMDGNDFDASNCNIFSNYGASNAAGILLSCLGRNGQEAFPGGPVIDFVGLQNYQDTAFGTSNGPITGGVVTAMLTVTGQAGDVFFLGASLGVFAHLGGFADTSNTLLIDIDQPNLVEPTFVQQTFEPSPTRDVGIDIKPESDPNCVIVNGHGVIPVAILGSDEFDVLDIDQDSLTFAGEVVAIRGKHRPMCEAEYSNGDEFLDLVCHFESDEANWSPDSSDEASVVGRLIDGRPISGTDSICIVP